MQEPAATLVDGQFVAVGFASVFGNDATHFDGTRLLQLAVGKLSDSLQIGGIAGSCEYLLFDADHCFHRRRPISSHRSTSGKSSVEKESTTVVYLLVSSATVVHLAGQWSACLSTLSLPHFEPQSVAGRN